MAGYELRFKRIRFCSLTKGTTLLTDFLKRAAAAAQSECAGKLSGVLPLSSLPLPHSSHGVNRVGHVLIAGACKIMGVSEWLMASCGLVE
jgi:hypothetical protein